MGISPVGVIWDYNSRSPYLDAAMTQKTTWEQAQEALARGDYETARSLIVRLLRREPENVTYLLFLSAVTSDEAERLQALERVLRLDPENPEARRGLAYFQGAEPPEPARFLDLRTHWEKQVLVMEAEEAPRRSWRPYMLGLGVLFGVLVLTLVGRAVWEKVRPRQFGTIGRLTLVPTTPAPTLTPSPSPRFTPTPVPLEMLLEATYTPTPYYLQTPHPFESFRQGLRAFEKGDWKDAVFYFEDLIRLEGPTADAYFFLGEAYRQMGQWQKAREAFQSALQVSPNFGPAYVGLALTELLAWEAENPDESLPTTVRKRVEQHFEKGLRMAPDYGEGYLQWAIYRLVYAQDPEGALELLKKADDFLGGSPLVAYWQARAYVTLQEWEKAREKVQQALERDLTYLPTYLLYAQVALAQKDLVTAEKMLETYRRYRPEDPEGRFWAARLAQARGDYEEALEHWLAIEKELPIRQRIQVWTDIARAYSALGEGDKAVDYAERVLKWKGEKDYEAQLVMGLAWFAAEKVGNAYLNFHEAVRLAEQADDLEAYYTALYWRAKALSLLDQEEAARRDWKAILEGPEEFVPEAWKEEARAYLFPPTATPTPTRTPKGTPTVTPSPSATKEAP